MQLFTLILTFASVFTANWAMNMSNFQKLVNSFDRLGPNEDLMIALEFDHQEITVDSASQINYFPVQITWPYDDFPNKEFHCNLLTATTFFLQGAVKGSCEPVSFPMTAMLTLLGNKMVERTQEIAEANSLSLQVTTSNEDHSLLTRLAYLDFLLMLDKKFGLVLEVPFVDEAVKRDAYDNLVDNLLEIIRLDSSLVANYAQCTYLIRECMFNPLTAVVASFQITYPRLVFSQVWGKVAEIGNRELDLAGVPFEDKSISRMKVALKEAKLPKKNKCNLSWIWRPISFIFARWSSKKGTLRWKAQ